MNSEYFFDIGFQDTEHRPGVHCTVLNTVRYTVCFPSSNASSPVVLLAIDLLSTMSCCVCIFQVNGLLHIAGQIGLIPGSMELSDTMESQAKLGLRHLKRILQVYSMGLWNIVQVTKDLLMI